MPFGKSFYFFVIWELSLLEVNYIYAGADLPGGRGVDASIRDSIPCRPKGSSLVLFKKSILCRPTLKFFLGRQYILTLNGSARRKKCNFFVKTFQKKPKKDFFTRFLFENLLAAQKNWPKSGADLGISRMGRISKKLKILSTFFCRPNRYL